MLIAIVKNIKKVILLSSKCFASFEFVTKKKVDNFERLL